MEGFGIPGFLLAPTIVLEIILPILIILGYKTQIAATLLAVFCIATGVIFHLDFSDQMQTIQLLKNFGLAGGFLFIAVNGPKGWAVGAKKKYVRL
ncbi:DoxX family membrane protein [Pelagibacteraceae bacterium]|nr:DoxX family membrane protein [Pelagibacteraceae bacterium]